MSFLRKTAVKLVAAGVLHSDLGVGGGYRLARPAREITMLEAVEAVDAPVRGDAPRVGAGDAARLDARL